MKKILLGLLFLLHNGQSDCDLTLKNGVNTSSCLKATECLKKDSAILKTDLGTLESISADLSSEIDDAINEYARCENFKQLSKKKPNIARLTVLANNCSEYYEDLSKKLTNMNENFKTLYEYRKLDLEDTLMATKASLDYVKKKCQK